MLWPVDESLLEPVINPVELLPEIRRRLAEEAAQGLRIGIAGQAGEILEGAIGAQERSRLNTIQAQQNRINQRQGYLRKGIALVPSGIIQFSVEPVSQLQHSDKFVEKVNAPIVGQTLVITGDFKISWRASHSAPYLTKSEVRDRTIKVVEMPVNTNPNQCKLSLFTPDSGEKARTY